MQKIVEKNVLGEDLHLLYDEIYSAKGEFCFQVRQPLMFQTPCASSFPEAFHDKDAYKLKCTCFIVNKKRCFGTILFNRFMINHHLYYLQTQI